MEFQLSDVNLHLSVCKLDVVVVVVVVVVTCFACYLARQVSLVLVNNSKLQLLQRLRLINELTLTNVILTRKSAYVSANVSMSLHVFISSELLTRNIFS